MPIKPVRTDTLRTDWPRSCSQRTDIFFHVRIPFMYKNISSSDTRGYLDAPPRCNSAESFACRAQAPLDHPCRKTPEKGYHTHMTMRASNVYTHIYVYTLCVDVTKGSCGSYGTQKGLSVIVLSMPMCGKNTLIQPENQVEPPLPVRPPRFTMLCQKAASGLSGWSKAWKKMRIPVQFHTILYFQPIKRPQ